MKFSIKDFISKCDQNRKKLRIWSHLPKKSLTGNFIFVQWWEKKDKSEIKGLKEQLTGRVKETATVPIYSYS